jgi:hypothetical protein
MFRSIGLKTAGWNSCVPQEVPMELIKKELEKIPGLGFVIGLLGFLFVPKESEALTLGVLLVAWMLYSLSN